MSYNTGIMEHKGFKAKIMEAQRLVGEQVHGLPPGSALPVYDSRLFREGYPETWMKGSGVYVIPVKPDKGLWFDFRMNDQPNTAVSLSVKGCNPITGLPSSGFHLDRYEEKCPKHGCEFLAERYCPECKYKWPDRGYLSGAPSWWDGFRSDDGAVRQFFFTPDELRDVASAMIGKENTMPAFGFAFFKTKEQRSDRWNRTFGSIWDTNVKGAYLDHVMFPDNSDLLGSGTSVNWQYTNSTLTSTGITHGTTSADSVPCSGSPVIYACSASSAMNIQEDALTTKKLEANAASQDREVKTSSGIIRSGAKRAKQIKGTHIQDYAITEQKLSESALAVNNIQPVKEVSVGAGARINQELPTDADPVDIWKDTPDSVMTIYFVFQEKFDQMAKNMVDIDAEKAPDGMLSGVPVG